MIPYEQGLVGVDLYFQAILIDFGANAASLIASDAGVGRIGQL